MARSRSVSRICHKLAPFCAAVLVLAVACAARAEPPDEIAPPRLLLTPQADVRLGSIPLSASELGVSLGYRFPAVADVGLHAAAMTGVTQSLEGCSEAPYCLRTWWRAGGTVEHHFGSGAASDVWIGLEAEVVRIEGSAWQGSPYGNTLVKGTPLGFFGTAKVGVDWVNRWPHGLAGFGVFAALQAYVASGPSDVGIAIGARVPLGFF
jgi:hypothetical protein